ncbi:cupredoxin family copper-binding protein [Actinokineospora auranticolor]|uniref:Amicyanin n=1 Tax=Actinokineospora auranticolor TaxID=155976 RepID=A0A2S6GK78_9PSEU|nr:cupredoxin family copper-binding protein [Actinokineospora auranticolor]PPK65619.1 amicyanin [Actinokineospora auranticolor]
MKTLVAAQRLSLMACAALALTACGTPAQPSGMDMPSTPAAPAAPVATNTVSIKDFAFAPPLVTVKAGTTVTWTNGDTEPHTVTSNGGGPLKSPTMNSGDTFRYTFTTPGHFDYLCTIHPFMTGTVEVTP